MKLYYSTNLNPRVAVAVARHLKSPVKFVRASPRDPRYEEAFRPINPNTLAPVLVEGDRSYWETDAIAWVDLSRRTGRRRRSQIPPIRSLPFVRFAPNSAPNQTGLLMLHADGRARDGSSPLRTGEPRRNERIVSSLKSKAPANWSSFSRNDFNNEYRTRSMRLLGVPEARRALSRTGTLDKKNRQFLAKPAGI